MSYDLLFETLAKHPDHPFNIKLYINTASDRSGQWVNFTSRSHIPHYDQLTGRKYKRNGLLDIGNISIDGERAHGKFGVKDIIVVMDNTDGYFNDSPGLTPLYGIKDIDGDDVVFTAWENRLARIFKEYRFMDSGGKEFLMEVNMGYFKVDDIILGRTGTYKAQLRLVGLAKTLMSISATTVKNGQEPYRQRPISYIMRQYLLKGHTKEFVDSCNLPVNPDIENQLSVYPLFPDDRGTISWAARLPHRDADGNWLNAEGKGFINRALLYDGTFDTDNILCGINEGLYNYNIAGDYCTELIPAGSASPLGEGFYIRKLWINTAQTEIKGMAVKIAGRPGSFEVEDCKIFSYDGTTFTVNTTVRNNPATGYFTSGIRCSRTTSTRLLTTLIGLGHSDVYVTKYGENILIPFSHDAYTKIRAVSSSGGFFAGGTSLTGDCDERTEMDPGTYTYEFLTRNTGYHSIAALGYIQALYSMGQSGFMVYNQQNNLFFYSKSIPGTGAISTGHAGVRYYGNTIWEYDLAADTHTKIIDLAQSDTGHEQVLCGVSSGDDIYFSTISWKNGWGAGASETYIYKWDISGSSQSTIYNSTADTDGEYYYTPLEMIIHNGVLNLCLLQRDTFLNNNAYMLVTHPLSSQDSFDTKTTGNKYQYISLVSGPGDLINCVEVSTGELKAWDPSGVIASSSSVFDRDNSTNIGDTESNVASNIVRITATEDRFYMSSAPNYDNINFETSVAGAYRLVKYDKFIFPYNELNDNENPRAISCWRALELNTQKLDYMMNYDNDGYFFSIPRPTSGTSARTFTNDGSTGHGHKMIVFVTPGRGMNEVYNYCTIIPYRTYVEGVKVRVTIGANSDWNDDDNDVIVTAQTQSPKSILLRAIDGSNNFQFKAYMAQMETLLRTDHLAGATIIQTNFEEATVDDYISVGDVIRVPDADGNDSYLDIAEALPDNRAFRVSSGLIVDMQQGAEISIIKSNNNQWLDLTNTSGAAQSIGTSFVKIQSYDTTPTLLLDTNMSIKVDNVTANFSIGDTINIDYQGLQLKKAPESPQLAIDTTSRDDYGIKHFANVDNRLFDYRTGKNYANYIVINYKDPHWTGIMRGLAAYELKVGDVITIIDPEAFKSEVNGEIQVYIRAITFEAKTNYAIYNFRGLAARTERAVAITAADGDVIQDVVSHTDEWQDHATATDEIQDTVLT